MFRSFGNRGLNGRRHDGCGEHSVSAGGVDDFCDTKFVVIILAFAVCGVGTSWRGCFEQPSSGQRVTEKAASRCEIGHSSPLYSIKPKAIMLEFTATAMYCLPSTM